jgi:hypothetical protein
MSSPPVAVVYLAWGPLGDDVVRRFAGSYRAHSAGLDHTLVVVFNGFEPGSLALHAVRMALDGCPHEALVLEEPLLDLAAYRVAARQFATGRCCFLNSYSTILAENWLARMGAALELPDVGLVGASASWASYRSYARFALGFGGPYARVFVDRRGTMRALRAIAAREGALGERRSGVAQYLDSATAVLEKFRGFGPFPARHVRTTGFMADADIVVTLLDMPLRTKLDTYRAESGVESLSARVERSGRRLVVVGADGRAFAPHEWPDSSTFWQAGQENLLIADNQTMSYLRSDGEQRAVLSRYAWGRAGLPLAMAARVPA